MLNMIKSAICAIVATKLDRVSISFDEVEEIYESGLYPEINAEIDYIIHG